MTKRNTVWIAIPAYTGVVHIPTMRSITNDILSLAARGDRVRLFDEVGNALLADTRSQIVAAFLESDGTHLVFVDWDVCWDARYGGMPRLVDHGVDLVAGMYPMRSEPIRFNLRSEKEGGEGLYVNRQNGLVEVWGVSAGFLCCSRRMLQQMSDHYRAELTFNSATSPGGKAVGLFDPYVVPGTAQKLGEDYAFCQRWRDMGGRVWIDPQIQMGHIGYKTFQGEFGRWVDENATKDEAA
jgi:hypothetical protein